MNVIVVEPAFPQNQRLFVLALNRIGASVIGIGEMPLDHLDDELKDAMRHYVHVGSVVDVGQLGAAVEYVQGMVWVDRLEATIEAHTLPTAQVREARHIPGTSVRTTWLCRDKPSMKDALRAAGIPTAASAAADSAEEVIAFADRNGFPIVLKPRAGAGAQDTMRVDSWAGLQTALSTFADSGIGSIAVEEFVEGHEGFYDTISVGGAVRHDWATHYYPNVLEAMRHRWISPQFITTNRIDQAPFYAEVRELGRQVIAALGIGTSATHMEWFFGPHGLRFSEIGVRPPGVGCWDLYSAANDADVYREWALAVTGGQLTHELARTYSAGLVSLRPDADGQVRGYSGIEQIEDRYGEWVLDGHFPPQGSPTQAVEAGYMANAYVRMRHPDYDTLRAMLDDAGRTIHVYAG
ncbi:MAG TPA: ATP-grasp domain-containing protein [Candidatus Lustribacter sp.]|nr:ATP-grasp domain-containing protein [Candidatus Lustribacter sp.]